MGYGETGERYVMVAKSRHMWFPQLNQRNTTINQYTTTYRSVFFGGRVNIFMMGLSEWCLEARNLEVKISSVGVKNVGLREDTTTYSQKSTCLSWWTPSGRHWYVYFIDLGSGVYNPPLLAKNMRVRKWWAVPWYRALPRYLKAPKGSQHITTINYNRSVIEAADFSGGAIIMMKRLIYVIFWRAAKKQYGRLMLEDTRKQ